MFVFMGGVIGDEDQVNFIKFYEGKILKYSLILIAISLQRAITMHSES